MSGYNDANARAPFHPLDPFNWTLNTSLENIPRYLFRVSDPNSSGMTTQTEAVSPAALKSSKQETDLYQMERKKAADLLNDHLQWQCADQKQEYPCNLLSWTSSPLAAFQYCLFRHKALGQQQKLSDIKILMVDTAQFDRGSHVFARDLQVLEYFHRFHKSSDGYSLESLYNIRAKGTFYLGEYLSQGRLALDPEKSCQVSMEELIARGLFNVHPGLGDEAFWNGWPTRVNMLRNKMGSNLPQITIGQVQAAIDVGKGFKKFELEAAFMILGISPYDLRGSSSTILQVLQQNYSMQKIQSNAFSANLMFDMDSGRLLEVQRWQELHDYIRGKPAINISEMQQRAEQADVEEGVGDLAARFTNLWARTEASA
ncbi:uncharacterized protein CTRU02_209212 [Colletotrichum truncatum]|uniref:Uncharacterized protein n=1 Tax=Colletotrichum truncatum TaxID=5467 RepID=A0ACC3YZL0_COLTU|nr:uncharacterized protein CTRU02_14612 [Colletotrichum truncatum]KAF6782056.1 hypothetical protein CTRU02_14612 [Colletotrichum truncatum]